jgi:hypothetical protein
VPGPRYLIPALPFLALGLAAAYERWTPVVVALAVPSVAFMCAATLTRPMLEENSPTEWWRAIRDGSFTDSVLTLGWGVDGWVAALPFLVLVVVAICAALVSMPPWRIGRRDLPPVIGALALWAVFFDAAPDLLFWDGVNDSSIGLAATALLAATAVAVVLLAHRHGWRALVVAAPLLVIAYPGIDTHSTVSGALVLAGLAGVAFLALQHRARLSS